MDVGPDLDLDGLRGGSDLGLGGCRSSSVLIWSDKEVVLI